MTSPDKRPHLTLNGNITSITYDITDKVGEMHATFETMRQSIERAQAQIQALRVVDQDTGHTESIYYNPPTADTHRRRDDRLQFVCVNCCVVHTTHLRANPCSHWHALNYLANPGYDDGTPLRAEDTCCAFCGTFDGGQCTIALPDAEVTYPTPKD